jgi:hypothetical protein
MPAETDRPPSDKGGGFVFMFTPATILDKLPQPSYNAGH